MTSTPTAPTVVIVATVAIIISNGLTSTGLPIFYLSIIEAVSENTGMSRAEGSAMIGVAASVTLLSAGGLALIVGHIVNRIGLRSVMTVGAATLGIALILYSRVQTPFHVYLVHFLFGVVLATAGALPATLLIRQWVNSRRGAALGFVKTGSNIGGALAPLLSVSLIAIFDWRVALVLLGLFGWIVFLPVVRKWVPPVWLNPEVALSNHNRIQEAKAPSFKIGFIFLMLCAGASFYVIIAVVYHLNLHLQSDRVGLDLAGAATAQSALMIGAGFGKLTLGALADLVGRSRVLLLSSFATLAAAMALPSVDADNALAIVTVFGLAYGGLVVMLELIAAESFGSTMAGRKVGAVIVCETIGAAIGAMVTGHLAANADGDYGVAFSVAAAVAGLGLFAAIVASVLLSDKAVTDRRHVADAAAQD